jgi:hypothetical protein
VISLFLDTNSDNIVAPFDAIQVINLLNHRPLGESESDTFDNPLAAASAVIDAWITAASENSGLTLGDLPSASSEQAQPVLYNSPWALMSSHTSGQNAMHGGLASSVSATLNDSLEALIGQLAADPTRRR